MKRKARIVLVLEDDGEDGVSFSADFTPPILSSDPTPAQIEAAYLVSVVRHRAEGNVVSESIEHLRDAWFDEPLRSDEDS